MSALAVLETPPTRPPRPTKWGLLPIVAVLLVSMLLGACSSSSGTVTVAPAAKTVAEVAAGSAGVLAIAGRGSVVVNLAKSTAQVAGALVELAGAVGIEGFKILFKNGKALARPLSATFKKGVGFALRFAADHPLIILTLAVFIMLHQSGSKKKAITEIGVMTVTPMKHVCQVVTVPGSGEGGETFYLGRLGPDDWRSEICGIYPSKTFTTSYMKYPGLQDDSSIRVAVGGTDHTIDVPGFKRVERNARPPLPHKADFGGQARITPTTSAVTPCVVALKVDQPRRGVTSGQINALQNGNLLYVLPSDPGAGICKGAGGGYFGKFGKLGILTVWVNGHEFTFDHKVLERAVP